MTTPHKLEYYGTGTTPIDITKYVESIDKFTDVGTGEIVSAKIMLDARFGDFVIESNSNTTPIVSQYDLFKLEITDDKDNTYFRYLIQDDISPQKNETGVHLIMEMFGRERYLQKMYFPGHFYFISFVDLIRKIQVFYNTNRGSLQPEIVIVGGDLRNFPKHTYGIFEFGDETTVYDALIEVVNRLSLPVAAGGAGQYFGLLFADTPTGHRLIMRIKAQGSTPTNPITLEKTVKITEVKQTIQGNVVVVKGQEGTDSFPRGPALWRSLVEEFDNLPLWDDTIIYENGAYVRYGDFIYQASLDHTTVNIIPTVVESWNVIKFSDYVTAYTGDPNFQYSPYTKDKQAVWRNWCANSGSQNGGSFLANRVPAGKTAFDALCVTDSNLVIRDVNAWRDRADFRVASLSDIPTEYLYAATATTTTIQSRTYQGMRVLVDAAVGTIEAPFIGNDKFGHPFLNAIVMQDRDGDWIVYRNARQFDECAIDAEEGKIYEYNTPPNTGGQSGSRAMRNRSSSLNDLAWRDSSEVLLGNDCFHYPTIFTNTAGLIGEIDSSPVTLDNGPNSKYTDFSAIRLDYVFGETDVQERLANKIIENSIIGTAIKLLSGIPLTEKTFTEEEENKLYNVEIYNSGWWVTLFESPFPKSTFNEIGEDMGELFGGDADNKRSVLDLQNLNQTPSGRTGYTHDDSNLLGPIDGIKFLFNFDITGIDISALSGGIPFRAVIYDLLGNVWISDTKYRFQTITQEIDLPLSSFRIYRARLQPGFTLSNAISRIINPDLRITEIFEKRLVKRINFHCLLSHDDEGRYDPITWSSFLRKIITFVTNTSVRYSGIVDAFHFTKTPVVIARDTTDATNSVSHRVLAAPIKKYPKISNIAQLEKITSSELDIATHRNDLWTATYEDQANICAEDSVYVRDEAFIAESESPDFQNTRKVIVRKTTYTVGDRNSTSGLIATVELFRQVAT